MPGQQESRRAFALMDERARREAFPWWQDYREMLARGRTWRQAVYIAWAASPVRARVPSSQDELAVEVLGLSSDRVISKWRAKDPSIEDDIAYLQAAPLLRHRRDIFDALLESATNPDAKNHPDRKLALEMLGDYRPKQATELTGRDGGPVQTEGRVVHELDGETAGSIFDILAAAGAIAAGDDGAEDDGVHPAPPDG